jgi:hypothetical protein
MQKIIQIHPCLLKLSRKQESVTDGRTDRRTDRQTDGCYYYIPHRYRGGIQIKLEQPYFISH